jgi:BlaI family penicillinase repressor
MAREHPQPSDAEWKVLHALWRKQKATARELLGSLAGERWAYTTLKTMLSRMEEKGLVRSTKVGNVASYEPLIEQERAERDAVRTLLQRVFEGASGPLLAHLAAEESVSAADRRTLLERAREAGRKDGNRGR